MGGLTSTRQLCIYVSAYTDPLTTQAFTQLATLADPTRGRLVLALEAHELTVGELCVVLQLPQSTVSRHLKVLAEEGWVSSRADGTSRYYRKSTEPGSWTDRLWDVVREDLLAGPVAEHDGGRLRTVLEDRRRRSREFFSSVAGQWDQVRRELFGTRVELQVALALLPRHSVVGDLGCGDGRLSAMLAPHVRRVIAVDASAEMLTTARDRLSAYNNVEVHHTELERLPVTDQVLDVGVLALVLHYLTDPLRVLREAFRVLKPGGRVIVVDMMPHERDELRLSMGHVWQGFSESQMQAWLHDAGFASVTVTPLPADTEARGPSIMMAQGTRPMT